MSTALVWSVMAVGGLLIAASLFWIAGKVVRVEKGTFGRATLSALFCAIVAAAVLAMLFVLAGSGRRDPGSLSVHTQWLGLVLIMLASVVILRNGFETTFPKAMAVWCCAVGMTVVLGALLLPALALLGNVLDEYDIATPPALR